LSADVQPTLAFCTWQAFPQPLVEEENLAQLWQQTLEGFSIDFPWLYGSRIVVDHEQLLELVHLKPSQVLPSSSLLCAPSVVPVDPASDLNLYQMPFRFEHPTAVGSIVSAVEQMLCDMLNVQDASGKPVVSAASQSNLDQLLVATNQTQPAGQQMQVVLLRGALLALKLATISAAAKGTASATAVLWRSLKRITLHIQGYHATSLCYAESQLNQELTADAEAVAEQQRFLSTLIVQLLVPSLRQSVSVAAPEARFGLMLLLTLMTTGGSLIWQAVATDIVHLGI